VLIRKCYHNLFGHGGAVVVGGGAGCVRTDRSYCSLLRNASRGVSAFPTLHSAACLDRIMSDAFVLDGERCRLATGTRSGRNSSPTPKTATSAARRRCDLNLSANRKICGGPRRDRPCRSPHFAAAILRSAPRPSESSELLRSRP